MNLPAITTGTDKQATWATDIRSKAITEMRDVYTQNGHDLDTEILDRADDPTLTPQQTEMARGLVNILNVTDAKFWIDNRDLGLRGLHQMIARGNITLPTGVTQ